MGDQNELLLNVKVNAADAIAIFTPVKIVLEYPGRDQVLVP